MSIKSYDYESLAQKTPSVMLRRSVRLHQDTILANPDKLLALYFSYRAKTQLPEDAALVRSAFIESVFTLIGAQKPIVSTPIARLYCAAVEAYREIPQTREVAEYTDPLGNLERMVNDLNSQIEASLPACPDVDSWVTPYPRAM